MQIKYSEIFTSFQGEAGFSGQPSVWLRLFGCNLQCAGYGQKDPTNKDSYVNPLLFIDKTEIAKINSLEEIPTPKYGCDSSYSWTNMFKHLAPKKDTKEIVDEMILLCERDFSLDPSRTNSFWRHPKTKQLVQLVFTGGEPMLWQKQMISVVDEFKRRKKQPEQITVETNGTIPLKEWIQQNIGDETRVFMSISPKLFTVSGEEEAVILENIEEYSAEFNGWLKFVVDDKEECWDELDFYVEEILNFLPSDWEIWVMPVGGTTEAQEEKERIARIADEAMKRGFKVATRSHIYIYGDIAGK